MDFNHLTADLLTNVLDALPDGILIVSAERQMVYTNDRFRELWNIPLDEPLDDEGQAIMRYALSQLVDPDGFIQLLQDLHLSYDNIEDEIRLRDGRVFKRRSVAFDDLALGWARIWIFTDITAVKHSLIDSLTGVFNRNKFERHFSSISVDASPECMVCVALIDLDHFKLFNDTYGHAAGDDVLRKIGAVIRRNLQRTSDAAYRVGGEEFFIQYYGRNQEDITNFIHSIRSEVEELAIPHKFNQPYECVTISCGFGICTEPRPPEYIYRQIDNALYTSKAQGRNQITWVELCEASTV